MAISASHGQRSVADHGSVLRLLGGMTSSTSDRRVLAIQDVARILGVIEESLLPRCQRVTIATELGRPAIRELSRVGVPVTRGTFLGYSLEKQLGRQIQRRLDLVALPTAGLLMTDFEAVVGDFVVEVDLPPSSELVALAAPMKRSTAPSWGSR